MTNYLFCCNNKMFMGKKNNKFKLYAKLLLRAARFYFENCDVTYIFLLIYYYYKILAVIRLAIDHKYVIS